MTARSYIKLTVVPILWGGALVAGRIVSGELQPFTITWIRFVLVSLFLIPVVAVREGRLPRPTLRELVLVICMSVAGVVVYNFLLFSGLQTVTAVRSSVLMALTPSVVAIILVVVFGERTTVTAAFGILLAFSGALVTITDGNLRAAIDGGISAGDLLLLGSVLAWAVYTILARYTISRLSAITVLAYSSAIGAILLTPVAAAEGAFHTIHTLTGPVFWGILYLSFGAAGLAYLWYYEGIRDAGATKAAVFMNVEPVAAIILGVVILGEKISAPLIIGAALVMVGLYLVNRR